ncbi:hypothetical protein K474DRAFT_1661536 [Panus rudis PR-1116 ss-1]|nr:hypothetical protein K474DRAFT_1661536 [Panus rudis PR-1116 ss-1]
MPPFSSPVAPVQLPALYLYPLNDSFIPKHISLANNQRVKIGRQTNAKTVPAERNGFFDSKVLSRQHAEVWEEGGKIFIKDVKSSNGTFINSERLSPEGHESEPFELKTDDVVEFGIDIVGEDNKTIIHHKVAAKVVCVFTEQDAQNAARAEAQGAAGYALAGQSSAGNAFNFVGNSQGPNGINGPQRRTTMQPNLGLGGMGGSARPPGKSGLTFDHILNRLQGELQKSRDTGADLHSLSGAMNDIHDTLGGNLPPNLPPYPQTLPPVVPPQVNQQQQQQPESNQQASASASAPDSAAALSELQAQLHETQMSLASHMEKICSLEGMLKEHEHIKRELSSMRELMEERKREMELLRVQSQSPHQLRRHPSRMESGEGEYDDDDARSVATVVPHELERVEEEDEEQLAAEEEEEERRRRRDELGRPRTPEPTGMGMSEYEDEHESRRDGSRLRPPSTSSSKPSSSPPSIPDDLIHRMNTLSQQLESALEVSRSLEAQHQTAQSTISMLESKVNTLESMVQATQAQVQAQSESHQEFVQTIESKHNSAAEEERSERESLRDMLNEWKKNVEGQWNGIREDWSDERERLRRATEEFESRVRSVEEGLGTAVSKVESGLASLSSFRVHQFDQPNGSAKVNGGGLVTPPSPRSLSAASSRSRQRKRRSSTSRGRSPSRSQSPHLNGTDDSPISPLSGHITLPSSKSRVRRRTPWMTDESGSDSESLPPNGDVKAVNSDGSQQLGSKMQYPITPEPSLRDQPVTGLNPTSVVAEAKDPPKDVNQYNVPTVLGVLMLSVAAAAVFWRVKPDTTA